MRNYLKIHRSGLGLYYKHRTRNELAAPCQNSCKEARAQSLWLQHAFAGAVILCWLVLQTEGGQLQGPVP